MGQRIASGLDGAAARRLPGRLTQSTDFQRLLARPVHQRSPHFALHYLQGIPAAAARAVIHKPVPDLSTIHSPDSAEAVENIPAGHWFGCVVPKRHARRSVTRSLIKRQMRAVLVRCSENLPPGLWLLRLRHGFSTTSYPSAASDALRHAARAELDVLLQRVLN
jgi:ribonuclease P protein component